MTIKVREIEDIIGNSLLMAGELLSQEVIADDCLRTIEKFEIFLKKLEKDERAVIISISVKDIFVKI